MLKGDKNGGEGANFISLAKEVLEAIYLEIANSIKGGNRKGQFAGKHKRKEKRDTILMKVALIGIVPLNTISL